MQYHINTDGSRLGDPKEDGPGGWAAVIRYGDLVAEISQGFFMTTNNRMEILAVIMALEEIQEPSKITIYSDSQYTIDGATKWCYGWVKNGWRKRLPNGDFGEIKNVDLFKRLYALVRYHKVNFIKVKAHSGVPDNERCDTLAKAAARNPTEVDHGYIPKAQQAQTPRQNYWRR